MDTFARGLLVADKIRRDGALDYFVTERYSGWQKEQGQAILNGEMTLEEAEQWAMEMDEPMVQSGRQEMLENILNDYILSTDL
jgi:xylose isomerase